jgi:hypothetical protein
LVPTSVVGTGATIRKGTVLVAETVLPPTARLAVRVRLMLVVPLPRGAALEAMTRLVPSKLTPVVAGLTDPVRLVKPAVLVKATVRAMPEVAISCPPLS